MTSRQRNIDLWENIYSNSRGVMSYPNEMLVRVSHRLMDTNKHKKILDYGFGSGTDFIHLTKRGFSVSGVEISQSAIDSLKERLESLQITANLKMIVDGKIPFPDNSFDVVIAWQVLYYNDWAGFQLAIKEINRVLRKGGLFIGTMGAIGDISHTNSRPLGDSLYESTVAGQEGAIIIVLDENQLTDCFPDEKLTIGHYGYEFGQYHGKHWIVSYEKGAKG